MKKLNQFLIAFSVLFSVYLGFGTNAYAINNTKANAKNILIGSYYSETVYPSDSSVDRYYKTYLEEGEIYSIEITNQGTPLSEWDDLYAYLCYNNNTNDTDRLYSFEENGDIKVLYRPSYSGSYYVDVDCSYPEKTIKYQISVKAKDLTDMSFVDENGDTYTLLDNETIELTKPGSKKSKTYYVSDSSSFSNVEDYTTIDSLEFDVVSIGKNAFKGNKYLKAVDMPSELKSVKASAFQNCKKLQEVSIDGKNVTIGTNAFRGCPKLNWFYIAKKTHIKKWGKNSLKGASKNITIATTKKEVPSYKKAKKIAKTVGLKYWEFMF